MKTHRHFILAGFFSLFFSVTTPSFGSAADEVDQALHTAQSWMAQIDAGKYQESYADACIALHSKVPERKWLLVLQAMRGQWGVVTKRQQTSHIYKPNGIEGLDGECMVVNYDTSFSKMNDAQEIVVLRWEDGRWRGAGYNAGPKANDQPTTAQDQSGTFQSTTSTSSTTTHPQQ